jgi:transcriptional regulator with XRE-family HTH domain
MSGRPGPKASPRRGRSVRDPIDLQIGAKVRELRLAHGLSQAALAKRVSLTFQQIQKYETGSNRISASMLIRICEELAVSAGHLLEDIAAAPTAGTAGELVALHTARAARALAMIRRDDVREAMFDLAKTIARADV